MHISQEFQKWVASQAEKTFEGASDSFLMLPNRSFKLNCVFMKLIKIVKYFLNPGFFWYKIANSAISKLYSSRRRKIMAIIYQMCRLLYEFPAETRLTAYRRLDIPNRSFFEKARPREGLWCWTWIFQFNWYFTFQLLVLLHSKSLNHIEV